MSGLNQVPAESVTESSPRFTFRSLLDEAVDALELAQVAAREEYDWRGDGLAAMAGAAVVVIRWAAREARIAEKESRS